MAGGIVDIGDFVTNTPLIHAVTFGSTEAIRELVACKADPNRIVAVPWFLHFVGLGVLGCSPIFVASTTRRSATTVQTLLTCKADPWLTNEAGLSTFEQIEESLLTTVGNKETREIAKILERWKRNYPANPPVPIE